MDERQIGLALALREVGVSSDISGFDARLILQKAVYLLEEAGIRLGYSFNWYLRGPYSPGLTRDLYDLASNTEDVAGWVLDDHSRTVASRMRPLLVGEAGEDIAPKAKRLELLASLHYLARRRQLNVDEVERATAQLAQNGKHFSRDEVADAMQELRQSGLL